MAKIRPCRRAVVGVSKVVTPTAQQLKKEFDVGWAAFLAKRGLHPETRAEVRARFMGRSTA